jgi:uncharacterized membrane protein YdjX (TVP38/TMEM64 family)
MQVHDNSQAESLASEEQLLNHNPREEAVIHEPFLQKHAQKLLALFLWLLLIGCYAWYYWANGLTRQTAIAQVVNLLDSPYGPLLYVIIYALRPLLFFSAGLVSIASGSIFGVGSTWNLLLSILYIFIGSLASATVAYYVGRFFGKGLIQEQIDENANWIQKYADRMRRNGFETILVMRFLFLPYDLVNYLAGILRIDLRSFVFATWLGSLPGSIAFASFGASLDIKELLMGRLPSFDWRVLVFGIVIFFVSIFISRVFKKREAAQI